MGPDSACACRIELEPVLRIDSLTDGGAYASILARLEVNGQGQFLVAPTRPSQGGIIGRIGPRGEILQPLVGAGVPNGLGQVRDFHVTPMDSVLVLHQSDLTLLDPQGTAVHSQRLPASTRAFRFLRLGDGSVVLNNYDPSRRAFVLLSQTFVEVRQFGPTASRDDPMDYDAMQYQLADLGDGRFAAVKSAYQYATEIWDTTGVRVRVSAGPRPWFEHWTRKQWLERGPRTPPFTRIVGVLFEPPSKLWIVAEVPDARTLSRAASVSSGERARSVGELAIVPVDQYNRVFDTVVEVVDVHTGRVLVSQRFDEHVRAFAGRGLLYSLQQGAGTRLVLQVWRPSIVRAPQ